MSAGESVRTTRYRRTRAVTDGSPEPADATTLDLWASPFTFRRDHDATSPRSLTLHHAAQHPCRRAVGRPEAARHRRPDSGSTPPRSTPPRRTPRRNSRPTASSRCGSTAPGRAGTCGSRRPAQRPTARRSGRGIGRPLRRRGRPPAAQRAGKGELKAFTVVPRRRPADATPAASAASSRSTPPTAATTRPASPSTWGRTARRGSPS